MKTRFLFPETFRTIGWIILIPAAICGILMMLTDYQPDFLNITVFSITPQSFDNANTHWFKNNISDELITILFTVGALMAGFSKQKNEDEYIASIRHDSLLWATYVNYALLILSVLLVYDLSFFNVMVYNMFTILIIFLLRFNFMLFRNNKTLANEK